MEYVYYYLGLYVLTLASMIGLAKLGQDDINVKEVVLGLVLLAIPVINVLVLLNYLVQALKGQSFWYKTVFDFRKKE